MLCNSSSYIFHSAVNNFLRAACLTLTSKWKQKKYIYVYISIYIFYIYFTKILVLLVSKISFSKSLCLLRFLLKFTAPSDASTH